MPQIRKTRHKPRLVPVSCGQLREQHGFSLAGQGLAPAACFHGICPLHPASPVAAFQTKHPFGYRNGRSAGNGTNFQRTSHRYRKRSGDLPQQRDLPCSPVLPLSRPHTADNPARAEQPAKRSCHPAPAPFSPFFPPVVVRRDKTASFPHRRTLHAHRPNG